MALEMRMPDGSYEFWAGEHKTPEGRARFVRLLLAVSQSGRIPKANQAFFTETAIALASQ